MSQFLRPPIVLLKEGTDSSQGIPQIISNINACEVIGDIVRTTLGPRGMDKLIHAEQGVTVTNDGATVVKLLNIVHPAGKLMVEISKAQDNEIGDGTTSVVVLAVELLKQAKIFLEEHLSPVALMRGYRKSLQLSLQKLETLQINLVDEKDKKTADLKMKALLIECAKTSLSSKLVSGHKDLFGSIAVDAVQAITPESTGSGLPLIDLKMIGIKCVTGGSLADSTLIRGTAFKRPFSYAGAEMMTKLFDKFPVKVLLLSIELELKSEKDNAEIRISNPSEYQSIVNAEWQLIFDKLACIKDAGVNVVLSRLPIGDLATQYFADHGIYSAGRVEEGDVVRAMKITNARILTTVSGLTKDSTAIGTCSRFEESGIGGERWCIMEAAEKKDSGSSYLGACTVLLRGGASQFLQETERSLHDAIMIVKRTILGGCKIIGGAGSIEMELSRYLRVEAKKIAGAEQAVIEAFAKALEIIPRQLIVNSGGDAVDLMAKLRKAHEETDGCWIGVDCFALDLMDAVKSNVWEPVSVRRNALTAAVEAACLVLSIDETVKNPQSEKPQAGMGGGRGGGRGGRGRGMRR
jgi:T-complex protein 1 subunit eta